MLDHNPWVNRYITNTGTIYYQPFCTCKWFGDSHDDPEKAHEEGMEHEVASLPPVPEHQTWVNMGMQFLDMDGNKRVVYTAICTCQWMSDPETDLLLAQEAAAGHALDPVSPDNAA